jgi:Domain of unknown function (DUF4432)
MATLFDRKWTRKQLTDRTGDPSQFAWVRRSTLTEGKGKGMEVIDFNTGSGLRFTVLPDRGLDIGLADYCGKNLCYRNATGDASPAFYQPGGADWLWNFGGGLVATCGLASHGVPCEDEGQPIGLHGRIGNTPAQDVSTQAGWDGDDYIIGVRGKVVEHVIFGYHLTLQRSIFAFAGEDRFFLHDVVTNEGNSSAPHMMLYHINFGWPVVGANSRVIAPSLAVAPRTPFAGKTVETWNESEPPKAGMEERVYYHDLADVGDKTMAGIINPDLNFGAYIAYRKDELPVMAQWKMMGKGTYVMALEPSTNTVDGRDRAREEGTLKILKPGESVEYDLEIGALPEAADLEGFEKATRSLMKRRKTKIKEVANP